ncbi:hypothetical protein F4818DRAFT_441515 [Hypoxylon cercidicola]|nr:hypothetical protein F4818DRAFT_441515 [Hypoxylon cercidicola]
MKFILFTTLVSSSLLSVLAAPVDAPTDATELGEGKGAPASWRLDCGSPATTALCMASNSGAHCDPVSGELTIILAGTCGACKCISGDQCSRGCGR